MTLHQHEETMAALCRRLTVEERALNRLCGSLDEGEFGSLVDTVINERERQIMEAPVENAADAIAALDVLINRAGQPLEDCLGEPVLRALRDWLSREAQANGRAS